MNYNKVIFGGHITADVLIKPVGGSNVANFTVVNNYKRKKPDGTYLEEACFLEVEAWGTKADIAAKFLKKGDPVMVEGRLKQSNWEDKNGNKRSKLSLNCEEIILMGSGDKIKTNTSVQNSVTAIKPNVSKKVAMIKDAGFEISRIDAGPENVKEAIDDLPF